MTSILANLGVLILCLTLMAYLFARKFGSWEELRDHVRVLQDHVYDTLDTCLHYKIAIAVFFGTTLILAAIAAVYYFCCKAGNTSTSFMPNGAKEHFRISYEERIPEETWLAFKAAEQKLDKTSKSR